MQKMVCHYYLNQIYTFYYICAYGFKNCILNDAREPNILCFGKKGLTQDRPLLQPDFFLLKQVH